MLVFLVVASCFLLKQQDNFKILEEGNLITIVQNTTYHYQSHTNRSADFIKLFIGNDILTYNNKNYAIATYNSYEKPKFIYKTNMLPSHNIELGNNIP